MVTVGIHLHVELFVQLYQMFCVFCTVLEMNIVISHTMYQQKVSVQLIGTSESGGTFIAFGILFGSTHETFSVYRIVIIPIGNGCYGNSGFEYGSTFTHTHDGHVSTIAPSPDADAALVYIGLATHILGCCHLVFCFLHAQVQVSAFFEVCTTSACTASVYTDHDETTACHIGFPTDTPCVEHLL